jgi:DNA processing protein
MSILFDTNHMKINSISPQKHKYLQIIDTIAKAPKILYFLGELPSERRPTVAIVGTRKPTVYGKEVTYQLTYDLAKKGVVIISGLALGIDGIAHRAALDAGGTTIAVLACGVDTIYPATHKGLADEIIKSGGTIISEYEPGTLARDFQFLARNRIVSGLSDAVIVTEAASRSGTLATVHHALDQGREVFAVPGNITSPLSAGCNALIKQGAQPITSAQDVLEAIAPDLLTSQQSLALGNSPLETKIIQLIQSGVRDGDQLLQECSTEASEFLQALSMMEISGTIRALGGNQWTLK